PTEAADTTGNLVSDEETADRLNHSTWRFHGEYTRVTGGPDRAKELVPTPWGEGSRPVYAMAPVENHRIAVRLTMPDGDRRGVCLDGAAYARVLVANRHYLSALGGDPNRPIAMVSCGAGRSGGSVSRPFAEQVRESAGGQAVHAPTTDVTFAFHDENAHLEVT